MSARDDDPTIAGLRLAEKRLRAEELHYPADSVASAITRLESQNRDNARVARSRDDLADLIDEFIDSYPDRIADAIIAAGWRPPARKIETVGELEALPDGSVVLDRQHDVAEKHSGRLLYRETRNMPLEYLAKHYGPFTVLWEGARDE